MHNEPLLNALCIFCEKIGADKSIIQGAGGNVSIKIDDIIWVKASGTWLADANRKNIFVPLNLKKIQNDFANCDFETVSYTHLDVYKRQIVGKGFNLRKRRRIVFN